MDDCRELVNRRSGAGQVAVFSGTTATRAAVDLGAAGSVTVQGLTFNANLNHINITATAAGPPSLILDGGTLAAAVTVTGGQDTISAPVQFQSDVTVTTTNPSDALTFSGGGGGPMLCSSRGRASSTLWEAMPAATACRPFPLFGVGSHRLERWRSRATPPLRMEFPP